MLTITSVKTVHFVRTSSRRTARAIVFQQNGQESSIRFTHMDQPPAFNRELLALVGGAEVKILRYNKVRCRPIVWSIQGFFQRDGDGANQHNTLLNLIVRGSNRWQNIASTANRYELSLHTSAKPNISSSV